MNAASLVVIFITSHFHAFAFCHVSACLSWTATEMCPALSEILSRYTFPVKRNQLWLSLLKSTPKTLQGKSTNYWTVQTKQVIIFVIMSMAAYKTESCCRYNLISTWIIYHLQGCIVHTSKQKIITMYYAVKVVIIVITIIIIKIIM